MSDNPQCENDYLDLESRLTTLSLKRLPWGGSVTRILRAALQAVEPGAAVRRWMVRRDTTLSVGDHDYDLRRYRRILTVGIGKAAVPMGLAAVEILGAHFTKGIILTKEGYAKNATGYKKYSGLKILEAGHPIPDEHGVKGTQEIKELIHNVSENDLIICMISGGGSALLTSPVIGVSLEDIQSVNSTLLECGATINEINILRKHLDTIKGGGLARLTAPATLVTLILSDVVNDPLDVIASGPCVPDPSTFSDAKAVLEKYGVYDKTPITITNHLRNGLRGDIPDTPKPGEGLFDRVCNVIVGNNRLAAEAALEQAGKEDFHGMVLTSSMQGEASQVGHRLGEIAREIVHSGKPVAPPACIILGGETTVTIRGDGTGGRNQEMALGAVNELAGLEGVVVATLATDGGDGPTDAAGAVVTGDTLDRARELGLSPLDFLARNDAYHFFNVLGDLLKTGPTQTNVNDLALVCVR